MSAEYLLTQYRKFGIDSPKLHIVLGSGLSSAFAQLELRKEWKEVGQIPFGEIPGMHKATASNPTAFSTSVWSTNSHIGEV